MIIRIITIHCIPNFGSVFQAYALSRYLVDNGFNDTRIIDYRPLYFLPHSFRNRIGKILNMKAYISRANKFEQFIAKYIPLTEKRFTTYNSLVDSDFKTDVMIAGGDQLWNSYHPCGRDDAYKLNFTKSQKISFGTSMGRSNFSQMELSEIGEKIRDYVAVSVRESISVKQLASVGINAENCVDPVMLLDYKEYMRFVTPPKQPPYLLVYLVNPSRLLNDTIRFISSKLNLKVILCGGFSRRCECDEFLKDVGPQETLSYIANAAFVLSASFHATLFSLLFHKQFATLLPDVNTNERIEDLLNTYRLSDRIIRGEPEINISIINKIDFTIVDQLAQNNVKVSKAFLHDAIKRCLDV